MADPDEVMAFADPGPHRDFPGFRVVMPVLFMPMVLSTGNPPPIPVGFTPRSSLVCLPQRSARWSPVVGNMGLVYAT